MFRIKTALLACLLLVCVLTSVTALGKQHIPALASFSEFAFAHGNARFVANSAMIQLLAIRKNMYKEDIQIGRTGVEDLGAYLKFHGPQLAELAESLNVEFSVDKILRSLSFIRNSMPPTES